MYSLKDKDYRRREVYELDTLHMRGHGGRNDRYEERRRRDVYPSCRRDSKEKDTMHYEGRDYKAIWGTQKSRYEHSRSRSPPLHRGIDVDVESEIDTEMGGLIFMCNKRTQRRCLTYNVLGMPMAKRHLAERVTLGMKLFLFEFESRELFGIFEATSRAGMNLEPDAFKEADIAFPVQVRFRVVEKCPPLREAQFKDAILENYFEANRFKFNLTKEQVFKLIRLFLPIEASHRSADTARNSQYVYMKGGTTTHDDIRQSSHNLRDLPNSRMYRRDEQWKKEPDYISKKQPYFDSHRSANHIDYATHRDYGEPASSAGYMPDYKLGKYHDSLGTSKLTSHRYEADTWPPTGEEYGYSTVLETIPSASATVHHAGTSATSYSALSSKYDSLMAGYAVGRTDMGTLSSEDRYWKADDGPLQVPTEPYGVKPSSYGRQGVSLYGDNGSNGQRPLSLDSAEDITLRLAGKKTLLPDIDYLPIATSGISGLAPLHVLGAGRELDYRDTLPTYGSDHRRLPLGYAEDSTDAVSKHPARYAFSNSLAPTLREESGYPPSGMNISDTGTTMSSRYARDLSPRTCMLPEARYAAGPFRPLSHINGERASKLEDARLGTTGDENRLFGIEQPASKPYYRHSSERYTQQSPERGTQRKPSVWERVSGILGPQRSRHNNGKQFDLKNNGGYSYSKKTREHSQDGESDYVDGDPERRGAEDESFVVDFKRRNRNNDHAGGSHHNANIQQRKRRFVRPEAASHDRTEHLQGSGS